VSNLNALPLTLMELCKATQLSTETLIDFVDVGILEPIDKLRDKWSFSHRAVAIAGKATRLHQDLDIDWPGIAFAISLLEELEQLRNENQLLKKRLTESA